MYYYPQLYNNIIFFPQNSNINLTKISITLLNKQIFLSWILKKKNQVKDILLEVISNNCKVYNII